MRGSIFQPWVKRNGTKQRTTVYWIQYYKEGRRYRECSGSTKYQDAKRLLTRRLYEADEGPAILLHRVQRRGKVYLRDFLAEYLESQRVTVDTETWERYQFCRERLVADGSPLRDLDLSRISVRHVSVFVTHRLNQGAMKATVVKEVAWLKSALAEARRKRLIHADTLSDIREEITPRRLPALRGANQKRERILLPQEMGVLLSAITKDNLRDAVTLALWTGLREDNIRELREGQVSLDSTPSVIRFSPEQMKGKKRGHVVRLSPKAAEVVWRRHSMNPDSPDRRLFHDFRPAWKRLMRGLRDRLPSLRFHDLRRSYVTYRLAAGIDPKTIQDEVGHLDSRMTMDCYGVALRDPEVKAWAREHFSFFSPTFSPTSPATVPSPSVTS